MSLFWEILIAILAVALLGWLIRKRLRPQAPAEPVDDPFAPVTAPRKRGPKTRSGAVALEEPDGDDDTDIDPPKTM